MEPITRGIDTSCHSQDCGAKHEIADKNLFKSIGSVLAGFTFVFILSIGTDYALENLGIFPPQSDPASYTWWMLLIALGYRCIYAAAGGYLTAVISSKWRPMHHVAVLGILGFVVSALGTAANWSKTTEATAWYPVLLVLLTLPCVLFGGMLTLNRRREDKII
jgi:hypothetical protein